MAAPERMPDDLIDAVREAADLVELAAERTELRKAGREHVGLCPFHEERSPSFSVNPAKGLYYCHGCQAKGDVIAFVQQADSLNFTGAVEKLAVRYGVDLAGLETRSWSAPVRRAPRAEPDPDSPAWLAWYALGGTVAEARADNPLGDARNWIDHRRRLALHVGDLDLDAQIARALGLAPWSVWTPAEVSVALRDAYEYRDARSILRVVDTLNDVDQADDRLDLRRRTERFRVLVWLIDEAYEQAA